MKVEWIAISEQTPPAEWIWILAGGKPRPTHGNWITEAVGATHWAQMELPEGPEKSIEFFDEEWSAVNEKIGDQVFDRLVRWMKPQSQATLWEVLSGMDAKNDQIAIQSIDNLAPCPDCYTSLISGFQPCERHK